VAVHVHLGANIFVFLNVGETARVDEVRQFAAPIFVRFQLFTVLLHLVLSECGSEVDV